ncbi:hypothetical protein MnTg02_01895 [bacterium MnTg02]|nr:hypothetical protein MnTg02_01895 [bacterium MnTg02]
MPLLAKEIPKDDRKRFVRVIFEANLLRALFQKILRYSGSREAGKIPFHIGAKDRHALLRKSFGENLQGDRFAGTCRAGDQAVPVGKLKI